MEVIAESFLQPPRVIKIMTPSPGSKKLQIAQKCLKATNQGDWIFNII